MRKLIHLMTIVVFGLGLAACSPAELFSKLATSEVEQASSEALSRQQAQQEKLDLIEAKKSAFPQSALLTSPTQESKYQAIAFRNRFEIDDKSIIDVEAIVPDPEGKSYIVWIKAPDSKVFEQIGTLSKRAVDDYMMVYETQTDMTKLTQVAISLDEAGKSQPINVILTGGFN